MDIVHHLDEHLWREFVDKNPMGNIFHTPEMFQVFARTNRYEPELWAAVDSSGAPLALLLPVQISVIGGWMRALTTRAVVFGSVLCEPGATGNEALALLLKAYTRPTLSAPLFTELRNLWDINAILSSTFREQGFIYEEHLNYLIDLDRPADAVFLGFTAHTRKNIRRGLNRGEVVIEEMRELEQVATCYNLLKKTYQNAQVPLADRSLFEAAFDILYPKDMVQFTRARVGDTFVAMSIELLYKDVVYGWYAGSDRAYGHYQPNDLLMWHILQWGAEKGYRVYDFGGAGKPNEEYGVRDFKAKFGGTLVCFGRYIYVPAPFLLRIGTLGYNIVRKFF